MVGMFMATILAASECLQALNLLDHQTIQNIKFLGQQQ
jgi:hypothetical protein